MDMKELQKAVEKYTLRSPMAIEDLYQLMTERWNAELPGAYKLKKGLMGKSIMFDVYMQVQPKVTIKGNVVTCLKTTNSTEVSVLGGPSLDIKNTKERIAAAKEGGLKAAAFGGVEYFLGVCDAMREILKDKI